MLDDIARAPADFVIVEPLQVLALPARRMWDAAFLGQNAPGLIAPDDRPGAPARNFNWAGDAGQVGQFIHGYGSRWLPAALLTPETRPRLAHALVDAARHWPVSLHFNKGLAGAPQEAIAAARDTAVHPSAIDAFALAISAGEGPAPASGGVPSPSEFAATQGRAGRIRAAMAELAEAAPEGGSYLAEADYFEPDWRQAFWGPNHKRLLDVKRRHDPDGLFYAHHGIGSEDWSADGFERL